MHAHNVGLRNLSTMVGLPRPATHHQCSTSHCHTCSSFLLHCTRRCGRTRVSHALECLFSMSETMMTYLRMKPSRSQAWPSLTGEIDILLITLGRPHDPTCFPRQQGYARHEYLLVFPKLLHFLIGKSLKRLPPRAVHCLKLL